MGIRKFLTVVFAILTCFTFVACDTGSNQEPVKPTTTEYTITYFVAGGNTLPADAISTYSISETAIVLPTPTRTGYKFKGWDNGVEVITEIAAGTIGDLTLTAIWEANKYTITFDYNGGEGTETTRNIDYGSLIRDLPEAIAPLGQTFAGWKTEDGLTIANGTVYNFEKDITLIANYSADLYKIEYDLEGGNALPTDVITTYSISETAIVLPTPTRTGYEFKGWNDGTQVITEIVAGTTGDLSLTASWQANKYTITFNYNGGEGSETTRQVAYNSTIQDLPTVVTPLGKTFAGWRTEDGLLITNGTVYNFEKDITVIAEYNIDTYTITYFLAGGSALPLDAISTYSISETAITLPTPMRTGYEFKGWDNGTERITEIAAGTTGDLSLTATWEAVDNGFTVILQNR